MDFLAQSVDNESQSVAEDYEVRRIAAAYHIIRAIHQLLTSGQESNSSPDPHHLSSAPSMAKPIWLHTMQGEYDLDGMGRQITEKYRLSRFPHAPVTGETKSLAGSAGLFYDVMRDLIVDQSGISSEEALSFIEAVLSLEYEIASGSEREVRNQRRVVELRASLQTIGRRLENALNA